mgnify:CR=1 FL=1
MGLWHGYETKIIDFVNCKKLIVLHFNFSTDLIGNIKRLRGAMWAAFEDRLVIEYEQSHFVKSIEFTISQ